MAMKSVVPSALLLLAFAGEACAQGILTPPGAPAPTMKSLDQIEARTPIGTPGQATTSTIYITTPGSYVLTGPVTTTGAVGINIDANDVSLDLNGFTISSTSPVGSSSGVRVNGSKSNIQIRNGHIRGQTTYAGGIFSGAGFNAGISAPTALNVLIENICIEGVASSGIECGTSSSIVRNCTVNIAGGFGITSGRAQGCYAITCGYSAIYGILVSDSVGQSTSSSNGIYAATAAVNCSGSSNSGYGISSGGTATGCTGTSTSGTGLSAHTAGNCSGSSSSGTGLYAYTAINCEASSSTGTALNALCTATNCQAGSTSGSGIICTTASACRAISGDSGTAISANTISDSYGGASGSGDGLSAYIVNNSYGTSSSGIGISTRNASNSYGSSLTGTHGIYANGTAIACQGRRPGGTAIWARIAVACTAGAGTIDANYKELSTN